MKRANASIIWSIAGTISVAWCALILNAMSAMFSVSAWANDKEIRSIEYNFETAVIGSVANGWTVPKTGKGEGSDWRVVVDETAPAGPRVLAQTSASSGQIFNLCVVDNASFRDVELSVAFKAVRGNADQGGGVVWRFQDANNYYIARYNPLESNYRLYKVVDGNRRQLATKEGLNARSGEWHTLAVQMKDEGIVCLLDGKKQLEAKDGTFRNAGMVGLWTKADAQTHFDDFQATVLTK